MVVMCSHGQRAMTAASILHRTGNTAVRVLQVTTQDWAAATGRVLA
jgi:rhodanese-related sulfurtransferase